MLLSTNCPVVKEISSTTTLRLLRNPTILNFQVTNNTTQVQPTNSTASTKRKVLATTASIFDPFNPTYLSPGHFLISEPLTQLPATEFTDVKFNRFSRWQTYQQQLQQFWQRWSSDYLQSLKQRQRCQRTTSNLQPGDLVLLREDKTAPLHWPTAVIIDIHPGKDGIVRVVTIRTPKGLFKRPIIKICPLTCVNSELKCNYFWGWQYVTLRTEFFVSISFVSSDRTTRDRVA